jgi:hypothetical protein
MRVSAIRNKSKQWTGLAGLLSARNACADETKT